MCGITAARFMGLLMASFQSSSLETFQNQVHSCCLAVVLQIEKGNFLQMVPHQERIKSNQGGGPLILGEYRIVFRD